MEIKTGSDIAKISMDDIIDFMRTRPHSEIVEFQNTAQALIEQYGNGTSFFHIRNWFVDTYFPDAKVKAVKPTMLDKIMAL